MPMWFIGSGDISIHAAREGGDVLLEQIDGGVLENFNPRRP